MSDTIGRRYLKTLLERDAARAEVTRAEATLAAMRDAVQRHLAWLSSFSMPPTSTIAEKQEAMARLERALLDAAPTETP